MNIEEIKNRIKRGLQNGYKQNILLLSSYNDFIDQIREYLLTVNVAQQLLSWNNNHLFKVQIEYPIIHFFNNAFIDYDWVCNNIFDMQIVQRQAGHSPTEKLHQKIDIAITQEQHGSNASTFERTLSGIELKGINKSDNEIIKDATRMSSAMLRTDPISPNSIEFCFCGFLRRFDTNEDMVTRDLIQNKTKEEQNKWDAICLSLKGKYPSLNFTIELFEIINTPIEDISAIHKKMDSDYSEVANLTGTVIGGILIIERLTK